jgi:serine/threonine protein kinase
MDINNKYGGKVLATGGFGCVFTPALKCIGDKNREKDKISKLMTNKHAKEEYDELVNLNSKLKMIPNYKNYFLIDDFTLCKPTKLTKKDLINFKECEIFKKDNITSKNINNSLDKLTALNMPYGGITIENFIMNNITNQKLIELNNQLLELLKDGIIKMNKKHIYHSDIKPSNILILMQKTNNMEVRLIDWSLSVEYIPFKNNPFPNNWKNRPLQFNVPFSIVLFTDMFVDSYIKFLDKKENKRLLTTLDSKRELLSLFVKNYLYLWMKERGYGHYKYINKIMYMLFKYDVVHTEVYANNSSLNDDKKMKQFIEINYTLPCIINYLVEIIIHFVKFKKDGTLNMRDYLDNIFIQTIDVWGFITSYLPLYELLFENYDKLTKPQMLLFMKLKYIFLNYLYEPHIETIKINNLVKHLKEINTLIKNVK